MNNIFDALSDEAREKLKKRKQPEWTAPMLATLTKDRFSKEDWIYERKLDGERCLIFKNGNEVRMMSRNKKKINNQYPEIAKAFENQDHDFIVDGEIVTFDGNVTSFSKLQPRMHSSDPDMSIEVFFYVFDVVHLDGHDLSKLELKHRKALLKKALDFGSDVLRYLPHRNKEGEKYLEDACKKNWEGLIAKDANSTYVHDRSRKWLKFKCENQQEFLILGYTEPGGSRDYFGALLIGYYKDGNLKYAGKVGTGYSDETLKFLYEKMHPLERKTSPLDEEVSDKNVHWIKPELVGEFQFTEVTVDGKLRHPSYLGLRDDKRPEDVKLEKPAS